MSLPASSNSRDLDAFAGASHHTPNSMRRGARRDSRYGTQPPRLATPPFRASADVMSDLLSMGALKFVGISRTLSLLANRSVMERKPRPASRGVSAPANRAGPSAASRGAVGGTSLSISEPSYQHPRNRPATAWHPQSVAARSQKAHDRNPPMPPQRLSALDFGAESIAMATPVSIVIPDHRIGPSHLPVCFGPAIIGGWCHRAPTVTPERAHHPH